MNRDDQAMFPGDSADEIDLALHADRVQQGAESIYEIASRKALQARRQGEAGDRADCGLWRGRWCPAMDQ